MDSTHIDELRRLNELNFARFNAEMRRGYAELDAKFEKRFAEQDVMIERLIGGLRIEMRDGFAALRVENAARRQDLVRWMVGLTVPAMLSIVGLAVAIVTTR